MTMRAASELPGALGSPGAPWGVAATRCHLCSWRTGIPNSLALCRTHSRREGFRVTGQPQQSPTDGRLEQPLLRPRGPGGRKWAQVSQEERPLRAPPPASGGFLGIFGLQKHRPILPPSSRGVSRTHVCLQVSPFHKRGSHAGSGSTQWPRLLSGLLPRPLFPNKVAF